MSESDGRGRHPATRTWRLPPSERPATLPGGVRRTSLRALAARAGRFEHHLVVVGRVGDAQIEMATASEPLYFAHANVSDEYALPLPTGDPMVDAFPFRVFLSDPKDGRDVGRLRHGVNDLVLHPHGLLHWPGRLRPPHEPPAFGPGQRRCVLSAVFCASRPRAPGERPLFVSAGREADAKPYEQPPPPLLLAALGEAAPGVVGEVADAALIVAEPPLSPARGGYALVLQADETESWPADLLWIPPGGRFEGVGVQRALLLASRRADAAPPPALWERVPAAPFAPFEEAPAGELPWRARGLSVQAEDEAQVRVRVPPAEPAAVPRYWLARVLYRIALHTLLEDGAVREEPRPALGYVETYGGFFFDDHGGRYRLGLRDRGSVEIPASELPATLESLYRAVAPPGYVEDLR